MARRDELAAAIVDRLYEELPGLDAKYGESGRPRCIVDTRHTLEHLAPATLFDAPGLFAGYIAGAVDLLVARGIAAVEVRHSLDLARRVIGDLVGPSEAAAVAPILDAGLAVVEQGHDGQPAPRDRSRFRTVPSDTEETFQAYLEALRSCDRRRAWHVVDRAVGSGLDLQSLYLGVFQPALQEIGRLWQRNILSVAEEHLATAITQSSMARLYAFRSLPPGNGRTLVAACAETERHAVGLRMLCDFAELDGWDTYCIGSAVPAADLIRMTRDRQPDVIALSASIAPHLPQLRRAIDGLRALELCPVVLVGGRPFTEQPDLGEAIGADLVASDAGAAVDLLRSRFP